MIIKVEWSVNSVMTTNKSPESDCPKDISLNI